MNDNSFLLPDEVIQKYIENLPDAESYDMDEIEIHVFEKPDLTTSVRPATMSSLYLIFKKDSNKKNWVLSGYRR